MSSVNGSKRLVVQSFNAFQFFRVSQWVAESNVFEDASLLLSACQRRHSFERELLHPISSRSDVEIAFRIGGDLVAASQHTLPLDASHDLERLAIDDRDFLPIANVEELLF